MNALARTWIGAWREAWANRRGFWTQASIMIVNNLVWVLFWVFFFRRVGEVRGWKVEQVLLLLSILTTSSGIVLGLLANTRQLGPMVADGRLDAALALPVSPLSFLILRRIETINIGDLIFGLALFVAIGDPTPARVAIFVFGVACSTTILTGFLVLAGSLSFFIGRSEVGELSFQSVILFSLYPIDIFGPTIRFVLYAVIPAGFMGSAPARLVDDFDLRWALGIMAAALAFASAGRLAFALGLRRYTSGAVWTDA